MNRSQFGCFSNKFKNRIKNKCQMIRLGECPNLGDSRENTSNFVSRACLIIRLWSEHSKYINQRCRVHESKYFLQIVAV